MELKEKAAYLKGLMEGLQLDAESKEGKVLAAMADLLNDICAKVTELDEDMDQVYEDLEQAYDELDAIDEDMDDLESAVYGDEDEEEDEEDDGEDAAYELTCPNCGETTVVDEDTLLSGDLSCPNCGADFEIEFESCDGECECCDAEEGEDKE